MNTNKVLFSSILIWSRPAAIAMVASALVLSSCSREASAPATTATKAPAGRPEPITLTSGWLMQDVAQLPQGTDGDSISKVGFAAPVYKPVPYVAPPTASANPPPDTVVQTPLGAAGGRGGRGAAGGRGGRGGAPGAAPADGTAVDVTATFPGRGEPGSAVAAGGGRGGRGGRGAPAAGGAGLDANGVPPGGVAADFGVVAATTPSPQEIDQINAALLKLLASDSNAASVLNKYANFAPIRGGTLPGGGLPPGAQLAGGAPPAGVPPAAGARGGRGGARGNSGVNDTDPVAMAHQGAGGQWPVDTDPNRPSFSTDWVQAPRPSAKEWYPATVPGTVLTTLVNNNIYPDPLYGENNRPNIIPDTLADTSYWYRDEFTVPASYAGKQVWLNFDGINYFADVWVNGTKVGDIKGAFIRGNFDVTKYVKPGEKAAVAVHIIPPPHPGEPWEKTIENQRGPNGGGTQGQLGRDGPTFVAAIGWDWVPGIRDRQIGIWQNVTLTPSGPVVIQNPYVVTDLPLPSTASADVTIEATLQNTSDAPQTGVFTGNLGDVTFQTPSITLPANGSQTVKLTPQTNPELHLNNPKLWWPNGFGDPNLYPLRLTFDIGGAPSDVNEFKVGIRKIQYVLPTMPNPDNLVLVVNGVPVIAKGGDWGMDDAMKRLSPERTDALIKLHKFANYTIIRNWVGQSTSEDFFAACDKYGIMVWDEFFEANPNNGRDPDDSPLYLTNVRDTVLRYRNHPAIVIWGGRNEGGPTPAAIAEGNIQILQELDPGRYYQASSTAGRGVISGGGGYGWRAPEAMYGVSFAFNTETGLASIPNVESIQSWMPEKDWMDKNFPNDDWAEHDLVTGAGNPAPGMQGIINSRYGPYASFQEFIRKAQMADYEAYRALYEGRFAKLFNPSTAVITWMSNPAQPCFVWQIYDYSLEPFASFFGVQKACEQVHIMMSQNATPTVGIVNNTPQPLTGLTYRVQIYNLDGTKKFDETNPIASAPASSSTGLSVIKFPEGLSPVHFVKLDLMDAQGKVVSDNFYWHETVQDDLKALDTMPDVQLDSKIVRHDKDGNVLLDVTLTNNGKVPAVMAHVQLRRTGTETDPRVLPVNYTTNYVSLLPGESKTLTIEAAAKDLKGKQPLVVLDGWNTTVKEQSFTDGGASSIATNMNAYVKRTPAASPVAAN